MDLNDAKKHYGSFNKIALALGIRRQNITRWVYDGIPMRRQYELERLTKGKLRAANPVKREGTGV